MLRGIIGSEKTNAKPYILFIYSVDVVVVVVI